MDAMDAMSRRGKMKQFATMLLTVALGLGAFGLGACGLGVAGCSRKQYTGEQRFPVTGKVSVDDQPMEHGLIRFLPAEKGNPSGGPITNGTYSVPEETGPNSGKYRVEINWNKPTGRRVKDAYGDEIMDEYKEGLPAKYHKSSELTAEISPKQIKFDFELKSK
jgi:hypothetical protein